METFTTRPELTGVFGGVATTHWIATAVGMSVLEAGGLAFDAAVAAAFVLQVVEPHLNGPGGDAPILVARHDDTAPTVICGQGGAPMAATIEVFEQLQLDAIPGSGLLAAVVPGAFGAWLTLLRDWGTLPLRAVLAPAIGYARAGHPLHPGAADTIEDAASLFRDAWPTSAAVFLPYGRPPVAGSLFRNEALAELYSRLLAHAEAAGRDRRSQLEAALAYWYEGPVAEAMGRFSQRTRALDVSGRVHAGILGAADLNRWRPPVEAALGVNYGGHRVFKCGPWSQGPALLQALLILEGFDLGAFGPEAPQFVHLATEALKLALADRDAWYGDSPSTPTGALLSRAYAAERRALITDHALAGPPAGAPGGRSPPTPGLVARTPPSGTEAVGGGEPTFARERRASRASGAVDRAGPRQRGDTCHLDVVDRWGNAVSATPSGGWLQSSPVVPELGFALGTRLQMSSLARGSPNALAPRKRPRTTLSPTMTFLNGRPHLAFGTPGGDQQEQWSLIMLLRHLHCGMSLQQAIDAPAFHTNDVTASFWPHGHEPASLIMESRFAVETTAELRARGHAVVEGGAWTQGRLCACLRDRSERPPVIRAGASARGGQAYAIVR